MQTCAPATIFIKGCYVGWARFFFFYIHTYYKVHDFGEALVQLITICTLTMTSKIISIRRKHDANVSTNWAIKKKVIFWNLGQKPWSEEIRCIFVVLISQNYDVRKLKPSLLKSSNEIKIEAVIKIRQPAETRINFKAVTDRDELLISSRFRSHLKPEVL